MDFEPSNRQKQIRMAVREFAEGELAPIAQECEVKEEFPRELIKKGRPTGVYRRLFQERVWRSWVRLREHAIILEEFWRVDPGLGSGAAQRPSAQNSCALWNGGTEEKVPAALGPGRMGHRLFDHRT